MNQRNNDEVVYYKSLGFSLWKSTKEKQAPPAPHSPRMLITAATTTAAAEKFYILSSGITGWSWFKISSSHMLPSAVVNLLSLSLSLPWCTLYLGTLCKLAAAVSSLFISTPASTWTWTCEENYKTSALVGYLHFIYPKFQATMERSPSTWATQT